MVSDKKPPSAAHPPRGRLLAALFAAALAAATFTVAALTDLPAILHLPGGVPTAEPATPGHPALTGWIPPWQAPAATSAVLEHTQLFDEASPFIWTAKARADSVVVSTRSTPGTTPAQIRDELQAAGINVLPTVVDGSGADKMAALLADPARRADLVRRLTDKVTTGGYDGLDVDFEAFAFQDGSASWPTTRPNWVAFVAELAAALHAEDKLLSVTTPSIYDSGRTAASGYWVYDWAGISEHIDRLRIMTYDYSTRSPGPIGPLGWTKKVVQHASTVVDPAKIELGVGIYGRNWVTDVAGSCPSGTPLSRLTVTPRQALDLAQRRNVAVTYDLVRGESTFTYTVRYGSGAKQCTVTRTVWFTDSQSLMDRAQLAMDLGIRGVTLWTVDNVLPDAWEPVRIALGR